MSLLGRRALLASRARGRAAFSTTGRALEQFHKADKETFDRVTSGDRVVIVDFYADWCGPYKQISPILEKLTSEPDLCTGASQRPVDLVTVDVDEQPELAMQFKVSSIPTLLFFKDGEKVQQVVGAVPEASLRKLLSTL